MEKQSITLSQLENAIRKSWGRDTAYHKDVPFWSFENPAAGQCAITALAVKKYLGGSIWGGISGSGIVHFWNVVGECTIDLTAEQFKYPIGFNDIVPWTHGSLLSRGDVDERYQILLSRIADHIKTS